MLVKFFASALACRVFRRVPILHDPRSHRRKSWWRQWIGVLAARAAGRRLYDIHHGLARRREVNWRIGVVLLLAGCSATLPLPEVEPGAGSAPGLGSSFNVVTGRDTIVLELHVTNVTSEPITLEFMTGQRYDFVVGRTDGTAVWRWSEDRSFTQALGQETLAAGESVRYAATWRSPGAGDYVAAAWLMSHNYPVELRTVFRVADDSQ
jgi:hypothetical protein